MTTEAFFVPLAIFPSCLSTAEIFAVDNGVPPSTFHPEISIESERPNPPRRPRLHNASDKRRLVKSASSRHGLYRMLKMELSQRMSDIPSIHPDVRIGHVH